MRPHGVISQQWIHSMLIYVAWFIVLCLIKSFLQCWWPALWVYPWLMDCLVIMCPSHLTHWGWVTHICVSKLTIIASDNGLSPGRHQAIIWTNAGILLIGTLGTNFSEISIKILTFSFTKMRSKVSSAKWRTSCLSLNELNTFCEIWIWWVLSSSVLCSSKS